jgi:hypothetical protein
MANLDNIIMSNDQTQPANHQADLESIPSSSAAVQKYQSFEATTAVLDTNELLHMIIAEVPLQHRTSLLQISKTWNAAVIKIGYTLQPSGYHTDHPSQLVPGYSPFDYRFTHLTLLNFSRWGFPDLPMFSSVAAFVINPLLPGYTTNDDPKAFDAASLFRPLRLITPTLDEYRVCYQGFVLFASETVGHEHEFITSPPLTQVMLSVGLFGEDAAVLRVR